MGNILIAGGYGEVGGRVAAEIARDRADRLIIAGRDLFSALVEVRGEKQIARASLTGWIQASAATVGAATLVCSLDDGEIAEPGVWLPEQVVAPQRVFDRIALRGFTVKTTTRGLHQ